MSETVLLLPGDGIGPEVVAQARAVLEAVASGLSVQEAPFGGAAYDACGDPLPDETLELAKRARATLLGAVGAPKYDGLPVELRPEKGLLRLRSELGVFANLRPVATFSELVGMSSLKAENVDGLDILFVRELIGGIYFSTPRGFGVEGKARSGYNTMRYSAPEVVRIAKVAFEAAKKRRGKVCSVDKANVLEASMLWREVTSEVACDHPEVELTHMYVDNAAMQLVRNPKGFDVILTSNLFGDILSDLASELAGSIGMLPSAALGTEHGLYEPVHGSAPDIAGKDIANPCAAILSVAMMLEHSLDRPEEAKIIRDAVALALGSGVRTADIAPAGDRAASCRQMGAAVLSHL